MKQLMTAAAILLLTTQAGSAESCHDHFVRLMVGGNDVGPIKTHVTQEIKGAPASTNYFYQAAPGHWMTQMIKPAIVMTPNCNESVTATVRSPPRAV